MRWLKLLERYSLAKRPVLKVMNPRVGTSIIPLSLGDEDIFFQYLSNKVHSLHFDGTEKQLRSILKTLGSQHGLTIHKMKASLGNGKDRRLLLHLKLPNNSEIRRLIKIM